MSKYTIRDVERLSGIRAHTIRIWEKRYGVFEPNRTEGNARRYSDEDLRQILNFAILNNRGYKISQIVSFSPEEIHQKVIATGAPSEGADVHIEGLFLVMLDMDEDHFQRLMSTCIARYGFEETMIDVIYPFFQRLGLLWQAGAVNPAREHFVSNLVRQKLISAIDGITKTPGKNACRLIFFLPEGEYHELGLLFYAYVAKKEGHQIIYLGQSLPVSDLTTLLDTCPCDILVLASHAFAAAKDRNLFLENLLLAFPDRDLFLSNRMENTAGALIHSRLHYNLNPHSFRALLLSKVKA